MAELGRKQGRTPNRAAKGFLNHQLGKAMKIMKNKDVL
jgi:hypothetical protein